MSNKQIKTYVFETRTDIRSVAMLHKFFTAKNNQPKTKSELGSFAIDMLVEILLANKMIERIESSTDAKDYLRVFDMEKSKENRGLRDLAKQIELEEGIYRTEPAKGDSVDTLTQRALEMLNG